MIENNFVDEMLTLDNTPIRGLSTNLKKAPGT